MSELSPWVLIVVLWTRGDPALAIPMPDQPTCERVGKEISDWYENTRRTRWLCVRRTKDIK